MPRVCCGGIGIEGEGAEPNQRSLVCLVKKLGLGPLRKRVPSEFFKQGKDKCFQNTVLLAEWNIDWMEEVNVCILPSWLLACEFLKSRIIFFIYFALISMPL